MWASSEAICSSCQMILSTAMDNIKVFTLQENYGSFGVININLWNSKTDVLLRRHYLWVDNHQVVRNENDNLRSSLSTKKFFLIRPEILRAFHHSHMDELLTTLLSLQEVSRRRTIFHIWLHVFYSFHFI